MADSNTNTVVAQTDPLASRFTSQVTQVTPRAVDLPYAFPPQHAPIAPVDDRWEITKGLARGFQQIPVVSYGLAGLAGDITGADSLKQWGYNNMTAAAAELEKSKAAVESFFDINSASSGFKYVMGTIGEMAPYLLASLVTGGLGSTIFKTVGSTVAKDTALKAAMNAEIESLIAKGVAGDTAAKMVAEKATQRVLQDRIAPELMQMAAQRSAKGAMAGQLAMNIPMEAASNWQRDVQEHGLNETTPLRDVLGGAASGAVLSGLSPASRMTRAIVGPSTITAENAAQIAARGKLGNIAMATGEHALSGAATGALVSSIGDITQEQVPDWKKAVDTAAKFAIASPLSGMIEGYNKYSEANKAAKKAATPVVVDPITQIVNERDSVVGQQKQQNDTVLNQYSQHIADANANKQDLVNQIAALSADNSVNPAEKISTLSQMNDRLMEMSALSAKLESERDTFTKNAEKQVNKLLSQYDSKLTVARANAESNPGTPDNLLKSGLTGREVGEQVADFISDKQRAQDNYWSEMGNTQDRIQQHKAAIGVLEEKLKQQRSQSGVVDPDLGKLIDWHQKQISDEKSYLRTMQNSFNEAAKIDFTSKEKIKSLAEITRGKDYADNKMSAEYARLTDKTRSELMSKQADMEHQAKGAAKDTADAIVNRSPVKAFEAEDKFRIALQKGREVLQKRLEAVRRGTALDEATGASSTAKSAELRNSIYESLKEKQATRTVMADRMRGLRAEMEAKRAREAAIAEEISRQSQFPGAEEMTPSAIREAEGVSRAQHFTEMADRYEAQGQPEKAALARAQARVSEREPGMEKVARLEKQASEFEKVARAAQDETTRNYWNDKAAKLRAEADKVRTETMETTRKTVEPTPTAERLRERFSLGDRSESIPQHLRVDESTRKWPERFMDASEFTPKDMVDAKSREIVKAQESVMHPDALAESKKQTVVRKVSGWVKDTIDKMPALKDKVTVLHSEGVDALPNYIKSQYRGEKAFFDANTGKIYIIADKIHSSSEAVKKVMHEGVAHFGLRVLFTPEALNSFLKLVARDLSGSDKWKATKRDYAAEGKLSQLRIAEEYVCREAERIKLNKPDWRERATTAYTKIIDFIKDVLTKFGVIKVTDKTVHDVLLAAVHKLTMDDAQMVRGYEIAKDNAWQNIRFSKDYKDKFGDLVGDVREALSNRWYTLSNGKLQSAEPTAIGRFIRRNVNYAENINDLISKIKEFQGTLTDKSDIALTMKLMPNRINDAKQTLFEGIIGLNNDGSAPAPETLLGRMGAFVGGKLKDGTEITANNVKEITEQWLYSRHAPDANRVSYERRVNAIEMKNQGTRERISRLEAEVEKMKADPNSKAEKIVDKQLKIEELKQKIQTQKDLAPKDLSGMSDETAKRIRENIETPENRAILEQIKTSVDSLREFILTTGEESKLFTKEQADTMRRLYPEYIPLKEWDKLMVDLNPAYKSGAGRTFNMGSWKFTDYRTGTTKEVNYILENLFKKAEDIVDASIRKEMGNGLLHLVRDNSELLSDIATISKKPELKEIRKQILETVKSMEALIPADKRADLNDMMRGLREEKKNMMIEYAKEELRYKTLDSEEARDKSWTKMQDLSEKIGKIDEGLKDLKAQREELKNIPEYKSLEQKLAEQRKEAKAILDERGFKWVYDPETNSQKMVRADEFQGEPGFKFTAIDDNGERIQILLKDPHLVRALTASDVVNVPKLLVYLRKVTSMMAKFMTTWNPMFVGSNPIRDLQSAWIHLGGLDLPELGWTNSEVRSAFWKNWKEARPEMWRNERRGDVKSAEWRETMEAFKKYGGHTSMMQIGDFATLNRNIQRALDLTNPEKNMRSSATEKLYSVLNFVEAASNTMENTTRLATFKTISDRLIENGMSKQEAYRKAALTSLDLTVNFTQRGEYTGIISSLYMFSNASIQSTRRMLQAMFPVSDKGKPLLERRIVRYFGGIMLAGMMNNIMNRSLSGQTAGVSNYDLQSDYKKTSSIMFYLPGTNGKFISIPITWNYNIPYAIGQYMGDMIAGRKSAANVVSSTFGTLVDNFSFLGGSQEGMMQFVFTPLKPIIEVTANRNYFGSKIAPEGMKGEKGTVPASQRYWDNTNPQLKWMAEVINSMTGGSKDKPGVIDFSPAKAEFLINQYMGGVSQLLMGAATLAGRTLSGDAGRINLSDIPVVSKFATSTNPAAVQREYAGMKSAVEQADAIMKRARDERWSGEKLASAMRETAKARMMLATFTSADQSLKMLAHEVNRVNLDPSISDSARYERIRMIEERKNRILADTVKRAEVAGVKPVVR